MTFGEQIGALERAKQEAEGWSFAQLAIAIWGEDGRGGESRKGDAQKLVEGAARKPNAATLKKLRDGVGITQAQIDACRTPAEIELAQFSDKLIGVIAAAAERLGLPDALTSELTERYAAGNPDNFGSALSGLERALEVAADEHAKDSLPANTDDAIAAVLARVDALNAEGEVDNAAELIAEEEARAEAGLARLYDKGIAQAILTRDVAAACAYEVKKLPLDVPEVAAQFEALRGVFVIWYERGRDKGLNFDLEVSIALARVTHSRAGDRDEGGKVLNNLGVALQTLGERETETERLEEALVAYRASLEELARERVPLDWAITQMNLGSALQALGVRETGTKRLEEAVAAHRAALEERTREREPLEWARTQMNLGNALQSLGELEPGTARLEEAVAAFRAALVVWTRERVPLEWARTQMNLGNALATLGERQSGTARLEEALAAYRAALEEWTRERVPISWALVQLNLCVLECKFFDKTQTVAHLDVAQGHLDAAREVYEQAQAGYYVDACDEQQSEIDSRRADG